MGSLWAIASAMIFGMTHVALRKGLESMRVVEALAVEVIVATSTVGIAAVLVEGVSTLKAASGLALAFLSAAGVVHFLLGWGFLNASTKIIGAARMSILVSLSPLFAAYFATLFLHERLNIYVGSGTALIVAGIWFTLMK